MSWTASQLRQDIYRILDRILDTGEPVEIERKGRTLRIVPADTDQPVLDRLIRRPEVIVGDPEELVSLDWSEHWRP